MVKNLPAVQETHVRSLGWEGSWRRERQPNPVFLPGESHGQRSLAGCSPARFCKTWGQKQLTVLRSQTSKARYARQPERKRWREYLQSIPAISHTRHQSRSCPVNTRSSEVAATEEPHFQRRKQTEKLRNAIKVRQLAGSNDIRVKKRPFQSRGF